jgi:NAD+ diphosphatase
MHERPPNTFSGAHLERHSELRDRADWLEAAARDANARFVPVWQQRNLFIRSESDTTGAVLLDASDALVQSAGAAEFVFLGTFREHNCFLIELESPEEPVHPAGEFRELRFYGAAMPADEANLLAYSRALAIWRRQHRYCGTCGSPTRSIRGGHVLLCSNASCAREQFPRIDPAIIVLVEDGDRALLGRQPVWPKGRYSTLAGFVEPGESLEDAVAREVREESGVRVHDIAYHSSQPWPFPSSLMLGFTARADSRAPVRLDGELEDARWFSRDDIAHGTPALPTIHSISFRLIEDWYNIGAARPLRTEPGAKLWDLKSAAR